MRTVPISTFKYDPYGRRTEKNDGDGTKRYIWDGIKVISEMGENGDGSDIFFCISQNLLPCKFNLTY